VSTSDLFSPVFLYFLRGRGLARWLQTRKKTHARVVYHALARGKSLLIVLGPARDDCPKWLIRTDSRGADTRYTPTCVMSHKTSSYTGSAGEHVWLISVSAACTNRHDKILRTQSVRLFENASSGIPRGGFLPFYRRPTSQTSLTETGRADGRVRIIFSRSTQSVAGRLCRLRVVFWTNCQRTKPRRVVRSRRLTRKPNTVRRHYIEWKRSSSYLQRTRWILI